MFYPEQICVGLIYCLTLLYKYMTFYMQEKESGYTPNRSQLFMVTHKKKDSNPVNEEAARMMVSVFTL